MRKAVVDPKSCVACGACEVVCPKAAIHIFHGIYAAVDGSLCSGCGRCGDICPAGIISYTKVERRTGEVPNEKKVV